MRWREGKGGNIIFLCYVFLDIVLTMQSLETMLDSEDIDVKGGNMLVEGKNNRKNDRPSINHDFAGLDPFNPAGKNKRIDHPAEGNSSYKMR